MDTKGMMDKFRNRILAALGVAERWLASLEPRRRVALIAGAGLAAVLGLLLYVSPYAALRGFQAALAELDPAAVARYLDREAIEESLGDLADMMAARADAMVPFGFFVPERVREAAVERVRRKFLRELSSARFMLEFFGPSGRDPKTGEPVFKLRPEQVGYASPGRFEVAFGDGSGDRITLVFGRRWLFFWKVVAIRLPDAFYRDLLR